MQAGRRRLPGLDSDLFIIRRPPALNCVAHLQYDEGGNVVILIYFAYRNKVRRTVPTRLNQVK